jgi:hypothetical protein
MPGDGSRPAVVYVGMFRTALSEQKGWVTPSCLPNFILIPDRKPDHRDIQSSHGSIRFVIPSRSGGRVFLAPGCCWSLARVLRYSRLVCAAPATWYAHSQTRVGNGRKIKFLVIVTLRVHHNL